MASTQTLNPRREFVLAIDLEGVHESLGASGVFRQATPGARNARMVAALTACVPYADKSFSEPHRLSTPGSRRLLLNPLAAEKRCACAEQDLRLVADRSIKWVCSVHQMMDALASLTP